MSTSCPAKLVPWVLKTRLEMPRKDSYRPHCTDSHQLLKGKVSLNQWAGRRLTPLPTLRSGFDGDSCKPEEIQSPNPAIAATDEGRGDYRS